MNYLLCLSAVVLLIHIQGTTSQLNKDKDSSTVAKSTGADDDLCKHSFHSFLCNPSKGGHKRRIYNGQKPGAPAPPKPNQLTGENSFLQSTQIRPDIPKPVSEPKLTPDTSNIDSVFQGPGYLPPNSAKPSGNLFGDNSFLDPTQLLLPTTKSPAKTPKPTTTPRTTARTTPQRPTTPRPTTPRSTTTQRPTTTPRPTTTQRPTTTPRPTTMPRPITRTPIKTTRPTTTEPNIQPDAAQNSGTRIRPDSVKPVKEDLCAHAFHSFLCDTPKPTKPRRIYNGQKPTPENTNILGENSFQQSSRVLPPTKPSPKPQPTITTYKPVLRQTTTTTTTVRPVKNQNVIGDNSYLSPTNLKPTTTRAPTRTTPVPTTPKPTRRPIVVKPKPEPEVQPDAAQSPSVRLRPDASKNVEKEDLCKHAFHSFLCDKPKPTKARRIYNGQSSSPENSNILGENSFQQPSRILPPTTPSPKPLPSTTPSYKPIPVRHSTIRTTSKPIQNQNIIGDNSYLSPSKLLPTTTRAPVRKTPTPALPNSFQRPIVVKQEPEQDILPDGAQNPSVRLRPDASDVSGKEDLCKHSFHSFLCSGAKSTGKRRNYNGQIPNVVGANSFLNSRTLLPPQPKRIETPKPIKESEFQQSTNINPASNSYLPPVPYLPPAQSKRVVRQSKDAGAPADHHHDHSHDATDHHHDATDHHHDAAGHGHDHAHGDHHGDHHHHHHNITLEQLCRDPFHAFLCLNVDTSKRRIYDGNPAQGSPSEQDTLQALSRSQLQAASSVRQLRTIQSSPNSQSRNEIIPQLSPSSFIQENNAQFRFQPNEPTVNSFIRAPTTQYPSSTTQEATTPSVLYTSAEPTQRQSATSSFLQNVREQVYTSKSSPNNNFENTRDIPAITSHKLTEPQNVAEVETKEIESSFTQPEVVSDSPRPRNSLRRQSQRKSSLSEPSPTSDTLTQQPIYRQRRPLRRKQQRTSSDAIEVNANNQEYTVRPIESQNIPEHANKRSDLESPTEQEQPQRRKFGAKIPRRRKLPQPDRDVSSEIAEPVNPSKFVRGPRGIASDLAATNNAPDIQCSEPFNAYQCNPKIVALREKRDVKENEEVPRRQGNMRGQAQGQEVEHGKKADPPRVVETRKERLRLKMKAKIEEQVKVEETAEEKDIETISSTTEDPLIAYQKGIDEELKLREIEENNRKEELKRRNDDLKNRKEELKRREKEQEGRKEEDKRRKEEMARRKVEAAKRKQELKRIKDADKSDDSDDEEDDIEDDEENAEEEEKDKLLSDFEKAQKADLKLREAEVKLRAAELERREKELIRREIEEKRRLMEAERRRVQDKRIEEELERQRLEKIRVAEELVRRQEEDDRRSAAKLKAESN